MPSSAMALVAGRATHIARPGSSRSTAIEIPSSPASSDSFPDIDLLRPRKRNEAIDLTETEVIPPSLRKSTINTSDPIT